MSGNRRGWVGIQVSKPVHLRIRKLAAQRKIAIPDFLDGVLRKALQDQFGDNEEYPAPPEEFKHLFTQKD